MTTFDKHPLVYNDHLHLLPIWILLHKWPSINDHLSTTTATIFGSQGWPIHGIYCICIIICKTFVEDVSGFLVIRRMNQFCHIWHKCSIHHQGLSSNGQITDESGWSITQLTPSLLCSAATSSTATTTTTNHFSFISLPEIKPKEISQWRCYINNNNNNSNNNSNSNNNIQGGS